MTTQAILPPAWESLPNGKRLRSILKHHRSAKVELVGTFSNGGDRHGPDAARFRFSISRVISVSVGANRERGQLNGASRRVLRGYFGTVHSNTISEKNRLRTELKV